MPEGEPVVLEQSSKESFDEAFVRYEGRDTSSVLSGLAEGTHYFRIGKKDTELVSEPVEVRVEFFPRDQLVLLLGLGSVVVIATMGTILLGSFRTREKEGAS